MSKCGCQTSLALQWTKSHSIRGSSIFKYIQVYLSIFKYIYIQHLCSLKRWLTAIKTAIWRIETLGYV